MGAGRTRGGGWVLPALAAGNALGILAFRHFVSLDGPMHLLHAAILRDALTGRIRSAQGLWVDIGSLDVNLGDLLVIGLTGLIPPFLLHKLLAASAIAVLSVGAWRLTRAHAATIHPAWLLVLPFAFGFVLILGFFHFIIASGIAFALCGWWVCRPRIRWREMALLFTGCLLGTFAHKSGGALALLLIGVHEGVARRYDPAAWHLRWSTLPRWFPAGLAGLVVCYGSGILALRFSRSAVHPHEAHHPVAELFTLRPMLLLDSGAEWPFRTALGCVLIGLLAVAWWARRRSVRLVPSDALLISAVLLLLASFIRTPKTELLYITDRAQWLALLLLACWLGTQDFARGPTRAVLFGILALHVSRAVLIERRMHAISALDASVERASRHFIPGALVVPVVLDDDWLARHRSAYAALGHHGIVFTGRDHLQFGWRTPPPVHVRTYIYSPEQSWTWIGDHVREGGPPLLQHILLLGGPGSRQGRSWQELERTLRQRYRLDGGDAYAEVWTLRVE